MSFQALVLSRSAWSHVEKMNVKKCINIRSSLGLGALFVKSCWGNECEERYQWHVHRMQQSRECKNSRRCKNAKCKKHTHTQELRFFDIGQSVRSTFVICELWYCHGKRLADCCIWYDWHAIGCCFIVFWHSQVLVLSRSSWISVEKWAWRKMSMLFHVSPPTRPTKKNWLKHML